MLSPQSSITPPLEPTTSLPELPRPKSLFNLASRVTAAEQKEADEMVTLAWTQSPETPRRLKADSDQSQPPKPDSNLSLMKPDSNRSLMTLDSAPSHLHAPSYNPLAACSGGSEFVGSFRVSQVQSVLLDGDKMAPMLLRMHEKLTQIKVGGGGGEVAVAGCMRS